MADNWSAVEEQRFRELVRRASEQSKEYYRRARWYGDEQITDTQPHTTEQQGSPQSFGFIAADNAEHDSVYEDCIGKDAYYACNDVGNNCHCNACSSTDTVVGDGDNDNYGNGYDSEIGVHDGGGCNPTQECCATAAILEQAEEIVSTMPESCGEKPHPKPEPVNFPNHNAGVNNTQKLIDPKLETLLLLGLMWLLWKEKADIKLILALAYILLV